MPAGAVQPDVNPPRLAREPGAAALLERVPRDAQGDDPHHAQVEEDLHHASQRVQAGFSVGKRASVLALRSSTQR